VAKGEMGAAAIARRAPTYVRDCNSALPEKYYMHALSPVIYNKPRWKISFVFISAGTAKKYSKERVF
jgi:hypothetical protein